MLLPLEGHYLLGEAMARQEGFYAGALVRPFRNNNPGDICWDGPRGFAAAHGATHGDGGINTPMAVFPTLGQGWAAYTALLSAPARFLNNDPVPLRNLVHGYLGARVEQVIYRYCPPEGKGNSVAGTEAYLHDVTAWMGCARTAILTKAMIQGATPCPASSAPTSTTSSISR